MTFRSVYNEEQGGFGPLRVPQTVSQAFPNVKQNENIKVLYIDNFNVLFVAWLRSIAWSADHRPVCI